MGDKSRAGGSGPWCRENPRIHAARSTSQFPGPGLAARLTRGRRQNGLVLGSSPAVVLGGGRVSVPSRAWPRAGLVVWWPDAEQAGF